MPPKPSHVTPAPVKPPRIAETTPMPTPPSTSTSQEAFCAASGRSKRAIEAVQTIMTTLLNAPGPTNRDHALRVLAELIGALDRLEKEALMTMRSRLTVLDAGLFCRTYNLFKTSDKLYTAVLQKLAWISALASVAATGVNWGGAMHWVQGLKAENSAAIAFMQERAELLVRTIWDSEKRSVRVQYEGLDPDSMQSIICTARGFGILPPGELQDFEASVDLMLPPPKLGIGSTPGGVLSAEELDALDELLSNPV